MEHLDYLVQRWAQTLKRLRVRTNYGSKPFDEILKQYSGRPYHNLGHLWFGFTLLDRMFPENEPNMGAIELAYWYHDYIYEPNTSNQNEERSALIAEDRITRCLKLPTSLAKEVCSLIGQTTHKGTPSTREAQILLDTDLAILGSSIEGYNKYEESIREEYSGIPLDVYNCGRKRLLKSFLARIYIFWTPEMRGSLYETQARKNLVRAVSKLT